MRQYTWQTRRLADSHLADGIWLPDLPYSVLFYVAIGLSTRVKPGNEANQIANGLIRSV